MSVQKKPWRRNYNRELNAITKPGSPKAFPAVAFQRLVIRLEAVLRAGQMCSNVCYNLARKDYTLPDDAHSMRESYTAWGEAEPKIRKLMPHNR